MGEIEPAGFDEAGRLAEEEGDQQRRDVGAVDVGVGHDDDALIAQVFDTEAVAEASAERCREV
jgi:hypothetical protein